MGRALVFAFAILSACTSASETGAPSADAGAGGSDGEGSDVGDVGTWSADDFGALDWFWYGTGRSDRFAMDRDCGIRTTSTAYGAPNEERVGVVA